LHYYVIMLRRPTEPMYIAPTANRRYFKFSKRQPSANIESSPVWDISDIINEVRILHSAIPTK